MKDIRSFSNPVPAGPAFSAVFSSASRSYISSAGLTLPALFGWGGGPPAGNGLFPFASAVPAFRRPSLVLQIGSSGCPARFPGPPVPPAGLASICRFCLPGSAARARFEALPRNPAHVILPCKTARLPNFPLPSGGGHIPAPTASLPYTIAAVGGCLCFQAYAFVSPHTVPLRFTGAGICGWFYAPTVSSGPCKRLLSCLPLWPYRRTSASGYPLRVPSVSGLRCALAFPLLPRLLPGLASALRPALCVPSAWCTRLLFRSDRLLVLDRKSVV